MNTRTRRGITVGSSLAIVGALVFGAVSIAGAVSAEPVPVAPAGPSFQEVAHDAIAEVERMAAEAAEAARIEAERVAAEAAAAEAARIEAERIAAEQAAADQAARDAAARQAPRSTAPEGTVIPMAPPAPAPAPPAGGDQQAGECREYNDANECTAWYTP